VRSAGSGSKTSPQLNANFNVQLGRTLSVQPVIHRIILDV
jgi:hypothetical protein